MTDAWIPSTNRTQAAAATALRLVRERPTANEVKRGGMEEGRVESRREAHAATFDAAVEKAIDAALLRASASSGTLA